MAIFLLSSLDHNEFHGHHAAAVNHSYLAYVGPGPAATLTSGDDSNSTDDHPWNSHSNDHFRQLAVAPQYHHHHHHHHHSPSFSLPGAHVLDGEVDSSAAQGISHPHPFVFSYRLASRARYCSQLFCSKFFECCLDFGQCRPNPRTSPAINAHQGSSTQMREHLHTQNHVFNHQRPPHHANGPNLAPPLVSVTRRGLPPPPPPPPMPDQNVGFFIYPPANSPGGHREPETDQFHAWERDWFPHFPVPSNHRTVSSFWHRHF
ncbi:unnamed protein product [Thlaspi arvense]|uniref:Uncharacterized protein n=1 Tax=Thlaspi arvense TaxID=13288 RepID=A0AAU9S137_THLAR|nr:unnamed protein product [Thlaspi arvense]